MVSYICHTGLRSNTPPPEPIHKPSGPPVSIGHYGTHRNTVALTFSHHAHDNIAAPTQPTSQLALLRRSIIVANIAAPSSHRSSIAANIAATSLRRSIIAANIAAPSSHHSSVAANNTSTSSITAASQPTASSASSSAAPSHITTQQRRSQQHSIIVANIAAPSSHRSTSQSNNAYEPHGTGGVPDCIQSNLAVFQSTWRHWRVPD